MSPLAVADVRDVWLTIAEAVGFGACKRTLNWQASNGRIESREIGGVRQVRLDALPPIAQGRVLEWLAEQKREQHDVDAAGLEGVECANRLARFSGELRSHIKGEALRRADLLRRLQSLPKIVGGVLSPLASQLFAEWACTNPIVLSRLPSWARPLTVPTFYRAVATLEESGAVGLIPTAPRASRSDDKRLRPLHPEVVETAKHMRLIRFPHAPVAFIHRELVKKYGDDAPSESGLKRLLKAEITRGEDILARKGLETYRGKAAPYTPRDYSGIDVGQVWCGDQHQLDLMVINPDRDGQLDRPWVTAFMDMRTRALVGWHISFDHNSDTNIFAFIHGVRPKVHPIFEHLCGLPDRVYVDNGKDYRSTRFELACDRNGVAITHAKVRNAKAKPVERFFGTLCLQFSQGFETYLGNRPGNRTERTQELVKEHEAWLDKRRASTPFKTLAELKTLFADFVVEYLQRHHAGLYEEDAGREMSPADVSRLRRSAVRIPDHDSLEFLMLESFARTVDRGCIKIGKSFYRSEELLRYDGHKVLCRRNPADVTLVIVYDEHDRKRICVAKAAHVGGVYVDKMSKADAKSVERNTRVERRLRAQLQELEEKRLGLAERPELPPAAPEPKTAGTSSAVAPAGAVIEFRPAATRLARDAAAAFAAQVSEEGGGHHAGAAPMTSAPLTHGDDDSFLLDQLGPRPAIDKFDPPAVKATKEREQREWDEAREWLLADLRAKRALNR
jgi:transposase InsO family protein